MARLFIVISAPQMFGFIAGHAERLRKVGYSTSVVSAASPGFRERLRAEGVEHHVVPMVRDISPWTDALALGRLCILLARERPDAVMMMGPKANLLGNLAAWLMGVPRRITLYVGIRQETMGGLAGRLIDLCDRVSLAASSSVLAISPSLRSAMISRGIVAADHVSVTGWGTTNGIDGNHFVLDDIAIDEAVVVRAGLGLPAGVPVIGFVGRLTEDKGLLDAWDAFGRVRQSMPTAHFLLVGTDEVRTDAGRAAIAAMRTDAQVRIVGQVDDVRPYMHISWVHLLPSYREGFGNATAEAAALAIPAVAYRATGVVDSVQSGETGLLLERDDIAGLAKAVLNYLHNHAYRAAHGLAARRRTLSLYHPEMTWSGFLPAFGFPASLPSIVIGPDPVGPYMRRAALVHGLSKEALSEIERAVSFFEAAGAKNRKAKPA